MGLEGLDWSPLDLAVCPVPGDPYGVRQLAQQLESLADDVDVQNRHLRSIGASTSEFWQGPAATEVQKGLGKLPGDLDKLVTSYRDAAKAMYGYAPRLQHAQDDAYAALQQAKVAKADLGQAQAQAASASQAVQSTAADYNQAVAAQTPPPLPIGAPPPPPPAPAQVAQAQAATNQAQAAYAQAQAQQAQAAQAVSAAQSQLDVAKQKAAVAHADGSRAADGLAAALKAASYAGIHNHHSFLGSVVGEAESVVASGVRFVEHAAAGGAFSPLSGPAASLTALLGKGPPAGEFAAQFGELRGVTAEGQVGFGPFRMRGWLSQQCVDMAVCATAKGKTRTEQTAQAIAIQHADAQQDPTLTNPYAPGSTRYNPEPGGVSPQVQWEVTSSTGKSTYAKWTDGKPGKVKHQNAMRADLVVFTPIPGTATAQGMPKMKPNVYEVKAWSPGEKSVQAAQDQERSEVGSLNGADNSPVRNFGRGGPINGLNGQTFTVDGQQYVMWQGAGPQQGIIWYAPMGKQPPGVQINSNPMVHGAGSQDQGQNQGQGSGGTPPPPPKNPVPDPVPDPPVPVP